MNAKYASDPETFKERTKACRKKKASRAKRARNKATMRAYREKNRDKIRAQQRARYAANPEKHKAKQRAMYEANPERKRYSALLYAEKNREKLKEYFRWYNATNVAKRTLASKAWIEANPERARATRKAYAHRRRARLLASKSPGVSPAEWRALVNHFGGCCAYCGNTGCEIDHIVPISKGGRDELANVLPACRRCNAGKGSKTVEIWLSKNGFTDPRPRAGLIVHADHGNSLRRRTRFGSRLQFDDGSSSP